MSENITERDQITPIVAKYFDMEAILQGGGRQPFVTRYVGRMRMDSEQAYAQLSKDLKPHRLTPIFLEEADKQIIQLIPGVPKPRPSNPWVNLIFFLLTLLSMLVTGTLYAYEGPDAETLLSNASLLFSNLALGIPFAASLMAILLAHEFGHYLAARYHKTAVTLPYFLPFPPPLNPFGTLGAFIQLREPPRNKRVLLDIGLAGPLAGLVIAIPILFFGLALSELDQLPRFIAAGDAISLEGNSIFYLLAKYVVHGQLLPNPISYEGMSPLAYWIQYVFTGRPVPLGGTDVFLHSVAWAGWAGLLVTALNLIPAGQLDGGHTIYALFGKRARLMVPVVLVGLGILGFFWSGWWLWTFLILFLGRGYAQPLDQITRLDTKRKALAWLGISIFILIFTPIPLNIIFGPFGR